MIDCIGLKMGNYRLTRLIGQGGFADVYLGEHIYLQTPAAIKVLHMRLVDDILHKFLIEARTIANLEHPHIVRVLEFGIEGRTPFLVMNYAPYGTLRLRHPRGTRLPISTIVSYVKQIASALQYAHNQKIIHRDIKPENILIGRNKNVLLSDFGLAVIAYNSHSEGQHGPRNRAGTTAYMAPEQLQGRPSRASDQYALGIIVYEWLCGVWPFRGTELEISAQHIHAAPPPIREKLPDISAEIEQVIMRALAKDHQQRYASVVDFAIALEQACKPFIQDSNSPLFPENNSFSSDPSTSAIFSTQPTQPLPRVGATVSTFYLADSFAQSSPRLALPESSSQIEIPSMISVSPVSAIAAQTSSPPRRRISRRTIITGLAGLATVGLIGIGYESFWNKLAGRSKESSIDSQMPHRQTQTPVRKEKSPVTNNPPSPNGDKNTGNTTIKGIKNTTGTATNTPQPGTATSTPTSSSNPQSTPTVGTVVTPTAPALQVTLQFTTVPQSVSYNQQAVPVQVNANGDANVSVTLQVTYIDVDEGQTTSQIGSATTNGTGNASFSWNVNASKGRAKHGKISAQLHASLSDGSAAITSSTIAITG